VITEASPKKWPTTSAVLRFSDLDYGPLGYYWVMITNLLLLTPNPLRMEAAYLYEILITAY
jgi:hypothetical protein